VGKKEYSSPVLGLLRLVEGPVVEAKPPLRGRKAYRALLEGKSSLLMK